MEIRYDTQGEVDHLDGEHALHDGDWQFDTSWQRHRVAHRARPGDRADRLGGDGARRPSWAASFSEHGGSQLRTRGTGRTRWARASFPENRGGESTLGNFVADVQKWSLNFDQAYAACEIAFMNPGGLRADLGCRGRGARYAEARSGVAAVREHPGVGCS